MAKYVIIDVKYGVSRFNEYLYRKNLKKNINEEFCEKINVSGSEIEVRKIPVGNKINEKTLLKFLSSLKNDNIKNVILSENVRKNKNLYNFFKNNLDFCTGRRITDYFAEEIYNKYITLNNKKDYEAELVLFCDNPQNTYNFLKKVCKKLKNVYIVAESYEKFDWVIRKIYDEFGFYIYFTDNMNNVMLKDRIYINLMDRPELLSIDEEKNNIIILNLGGNSIMSKSFLNTFCFRISAEFKETAKYFKYIDQECIEFLVNAVYKGFSDNNMRRFINEYSVKLKKICLKNY